MANGINLIVTKEAQSQVTELIASLNNVKTEISNVSAEAIKMSKALKDIKKPSDLVDASKKSEEQIKSLTKTIEKNEDIISNSRKKAVVDTEKQRLAEIKLQKDREKAFDKYEADLVRETNTQAKLNSAYNKIQTSLTSIQKEYQDLAIRKEINNNLTDKELLRMTTLHKEMVIYDGALKRVDQQMGKHGRNVGNYASHWDGLGNSINQLTREAPAFAVNLQTGFLALSNNIPILADEISQLINTNKELIAQGKPTQSVFKAIAGSFFSWMTLLSVGVTLITLYGDEMVVFISRFFEANKVMKTNLEIQNEINEARNEGVKKSISNKVRLEEEILKVYNLNIAESDRLKLAQKMIDTYPKIFKGITAENVLRKEGRRTEDGRLVYFDNLFKALSAQSQIESLMESQTKLREEALGKLKKNGLEIEEEKIKKLTLAVELERKNKTQQQLEQERVNRALASGSQIVDTRTFKEKALASALIRKQEILNTTLELDEQIKKYRLEILKLQELSILLETEESNNSKENSIQRLDFIDDLISKHELYIKLIEEQININKTISEDESKSFEKRRLARDQFYEDSKKTALAQKDEALRLLEIERQKELQTIAESKDSRANKIKAIESLNKDQANKTDIINQEYTNSLRLINVEVEKLVDNQLKLKDATDEELIKIKEDELKKLRELVQLSEKITTDDDPALKSRFEFLKKELDAQSKILEKEVELKDVRRQLKELTDSGDSDSEKFNALKKRELDLEIDITNEKVKQNTALAKTNELLDDYLKRFKDDFIQKSGFEGSFEFLEKLQNKTIKFGKDWKATSVGLSEVAQEAFNFQNRNREAQIQGELKQLELSKENAEIYATTQEQKAELDRQYSEKRNEILNKQAKQQKDAALFNIFVDTAQAIVASLKTDPTGLLAIAIGSIGALNLASVASRDIPQFKDGVVDFKGGLAILGDGGVSEVVKTPDGKMFKTPNKDTLYNLPKHTTVYKNEEEALLNNSVVNQIGMINKNTNITPSQMDGIMGKYFSKIQVNSTIIDKAGVRHLTTVNNQKSILLNNRVSFKGFSV